MKQLSNQQIMQVAGGMIPVERDLTRHLFGHASQSVNTRGLATTNPYAGSVTLDISRTLDSINRYMA